MKGKRSIDLISALAILASGCVLVSGAADWIRSQSAPYDSSTAEAMNANRDTHPQWSPDGSMIAYLAERNGSEDLYVMEANGSNVIQLTADSYNEMNVQWSPDGAKILFTPQVFPLNIWVVNSDGSELKRLTDVTITPEDPKWSPDGMRIALIQEDEMRQSVYMLDVNEGPPVLVTEGYEGTFFDSLGWAADGGYLGFRAWAMDSVSHVVTFRLADGSFHELTNLGFGPHWSPEENKLTFLKYYENASEPDLFVANPDGTGQFLIGHIDGRGITSFISSPPVFGFSIDWSPDGSKLAFTNEHKKVNSIEIANADGTGLHMLTEEVSHAFDPDWSPDGKWISFFSFDKTYSIWVIRVDGSELIALANGEPFQGNFAWSPDGNYAVFTSNRDGDEDLYLFTVATGDILQLTDEGTQD